MDSEELDKACRAMERMTNDSSFRRLSHNQDLAKWIKLRFKLNRLQARKCTCNPELAQHINFIQAQLDTLSPWTKGYRKRR